MLFRWLSWCMAARVRMLEADRTLIEQWAAHMGRTSARSTVAAALVPVCGFYRWAHQEGLIVADPGRYVRRPSRPRRSNLRWLSASQAADLLDAAIQAGPPMGGIVHLLLLNGLRLTETLTARVEHLETIEDQTVLLLPSRKAGVMDRVALPAATIAVLAPHREGRDRGRMWGRAITPGEVCRYLDALSDSIGLDFRARPHMLRATFVTLSLDAGVPARDIIASAGWVSGQMLSYYDRAHASIRRNASHRLAGYVGRARRDSNPQPSDP